MSEEQRLMDEAAEKAKAELMLMPKEAVAPIALWLKSWYLSAGYKRLGKILVAYAKTL